ncbi:probable ATP-dependent RNA helicase DDX20 [Ostrinia furnacalis]|uniref:probable ATP-dependent RNA helicase DDX20 n=1 Tax=Ostrinia furnacalis TaxID=93504 RepID=UPI00103D7592|nr:probable ATP-dependent RNA helicase DDX20 [Ostrinia furnacalis]
MVLAHDINEGNRTCDVQIVQNVTFESMLLAPNTLQGLKQSGFYKPSPVQLHGIPLGKCGFDLLLEAKSGTGKTAVFSVISLETLDLGKGVQVIILAPTREIAFQICDVIKQIGSHYKGLAVEVVIGGLPVEEDIRKFEKNVHVVVGSPGRLRHLIQSKYIDVSSVRLLILDEADKLMEKSFQADVNYIFSTLPAQKQVIMSSATYSESTKEFITKYIKCAQHVCPDISCILLGVEQKKTVVNCNSNIVRQTKNRFQELLKILTKKQFKQCLIFCNYQARVAELHKLLSRQNWPVEQLRGQQDQTDRLDALKILKEYKCRILVSTDLAARGIDASNVDLVIHFEPPSEWQTYLHRIGRAGRYGSYGLSIAILSEGKEEVQFENMIQAINLNNLKVTNLWADESENSASNVNLPLSLTKQNNLTAGELEAVSKEVWDDLLCLNSNKEKLEEFDKLRESFEESKNFKIESFTDLINSFEENKDDTSNTDISHNLLKIIPKTSIKHFYESVKSLVNGQKPKPNEKDMSRMESNNKSLDVLNNGKKQTFNPRTDNFISENNNMNALNPLDDFTNTDACSSKDLIDAGLPSSFGTSKGRYSKKTNRKKYIKNRHITTDNGEELQSKQYEVKNDQQYKQTTDRKIKKESTYEPQESLSPIIIRNNNYGNHASKKKVNINMKKVQSDSTNSDDSDTLHENHYVYQEKYTEDYKSWYYQLKNRVKLIEIALYIEELSNM